MQCCVIGLCIYCVFDVFRLSETFLIAVFQGQHTSSHNTRPHNGEAQGRRRAFPKVARHTSQPLIIFRSTLQCRTPHGHSRHRRRPCHRRTRYNLPPFSHRRPKASNPPHLRGLTTAHPFHKRIDSPRILVGRIPKYIQRTQQTYVFQRQPDIWELGMCSSCVFGEVAGGGAKED